MTEAHVRTRGGRLAALAVGLAVTLAATSCAGGKSGQATGGSGSDDPGVVHVHGLGVDPQDGALYAATHTGLFRVGADGTAERVANRYQDTMGFTVIGPKTFLGSGHPDLRENLPARLGLMESKDAGQTWQALSLQGQSDFHALHAAHGSVFGYDSTSGTFMVSTDRKEWDARSRLPMHDFAVSPASADVVLATTEQGLGHSADGGRSWHAMSDAPDLVVLAWPRPTSLYGVAPDGTVHFSADGGMTWTKRGTVGGTPEALTVDDRGGASTVYVAVSGRGILASSDGGTTFTTRFAG